MIFDRALSAAEIQAIYDDQKPGGVGMMDESQLSGLASVGPIIGVMTMGIILH